MKKVVGFAFFFFCILGTNAFADSPIAGTWVGLVSTPWTSPYNVKFVFRTDGTYSSEALGPGCYPGPMKIGDGCSPQKLPALYYGSDGYDSKKVYEVNALEDQSLVGKITIYFKGSNTAIPTDFQYIRLRKPTSEGTDTYLDFSIIYKKNGGSYGPLLYSLKKVP